MPQDKTLDDLGIPSDYGTNPHLPRYEEASVLEDVELNVVGRMQRLAPETARDWRAMKDAALLDGQELLLVSGFRSIDYQRELLRKKLDAGVPLAVILTVNAAPGYSQHHTGRAVDVAARGSRPLTEAFDRTSCFLWLLDRAHEFGFRMPYGRGNVFGLAYEPWHWSQVD
jgi:D-alanyl-D-alanine carboxypeptidase